MCARRQLLGHDGSGDQRHGVDGGRHVPQGVELLVRRRQIAALADDGHADVFHLGAEFLRRQGGAESGEGLQLIHSAAGVAQAPAGHFCHFSAQRGHDGGHNQGGLVADAAGGVLIHGQIAEAAEIHRVAGAHHGIGKDGGFVVIHAPEPHRHGPGGHLVVGDGAVGIAADQKADFLVGEDAAVAFFLNQINSSHENLPLSSKPPLCRGTRGLV